MAALIFFLLSLGCSIFKFQSRLEAENAVVRQQLIVLQRKDGRVQFTNSSSDEASVRGLHQGQQSIRTA